MRRGAEEPLLPSPSSAKRNDRGVRADSVTNQLRALVKQKPRKRRTLTLKPLEEAARKSVSSLPNNAEVRECVSVQTQIQGPVSLQWLIDDFVQAAGVGDIEKVDHYIRGGIPIDMKHSVLQQTALHASAALQQDTVTRHLVQAGASVDALTKDRESTLHLAARYHSVSVAKEVLRNNADMRVVNKSDMLAVEVAAEIHDETMEHLLEPPPNPPSNVQASAISATSITVTWSTHQRSSNYQSRVSWVLSGSLGEFFEICPSLSYRINNLMPAASYEIRVQTGNHTVGWSASSELLVVETDGDVPNAMAAPNILRVTDHSITMRIRLPPCNGADIQRVSIQSQCTGSIAAVSTSSFRKLLRSADQDQRWESVICEASLMPNSEDNPHDKEHTVGGLLPGHVYYFRVKASNRLGWSPDGEVSDGICTNDEPKVVASTPRSVVLVWTKPYSTELIDKYQVRARASYSTKWEIVADDIYEQRTEINDLIPATAYSFRVVPHYASSQGWEDAEGCASTELCSTQTTVPEPPIALRVVDRTAQSIILSWETPRCNGHAIETYRVEYRVSRRGVDAEDWVVADADIPVSSTTHTVTRLASGRPYQLRVCARNTKGEGHFAQLLDPPIWTYGFSPPTAAVCVAKTSFSLTITWQDGTSADEASPASEPYAQLYEVQMCHIDSSYSQASDLTEIISSTGKWLTVIGDSKDRQAVVSGLSPLGFYCFRVRARAAPPTDPLQFTAVHEASLGDDGGSVFSPISEVFQTLRRM